MILAVDSSVMLSILKEESSQSVWLEYLLDLGAESDLVVCDVVYAELASFYKQPKELNATLDALGLRFDAIQPSAAFAAGHIYLSYRKAGGPRTSLVPDFLVGAHAMHQCQGLLTTDRGYLRSHFKGLKILQPKAAS